MIDFITSAILNKRIKAFEKNGSSSGNSGGNIDGDCLPLSGGKMSGDINMNNQSINNLARAEDYRQPITGEFLETSGISGDFTTEKVYKLYSVELPRAGMNRFSIHLWLKTETNYGFGGFAIARLHINGSSTAISANLEIEALFGSFSGHHWKCYVDNTRDDIFIFYLLSDMRQSSGTMVSTQYYVMPIDLTEPLKNGQRFYQYQEFSGTPSTLTITDMSEQTTDLNMNGHCIRNLSTYEILNDSDAVSYAFLKRHVEERLQNIAPDIPGGQGLDTLARMLTWFANGNIKDEFVTREEIDSLRNDFDHLQQIVNRMQERLDGAGIPN